MKPVIYGSQGFQCPRLPHLQNRTYGQKNFPQNHEHHKSAVLRSPTLAARGLSLINYTFITEEFAETLDKFRLVNRGAVQSHFLNNGDHSPPTFNAPEKLGIKR
jgi:hypothetical protein